MSTFNFRYAQEQGQNISSPFAFAPPANQVAQSPGTFNNAQQNNTPAAAPQQPSMPAVNQQQSAQQQAAQQQEQYKQTLTTWVSAIMGVKQTIINTGRLGIGISRVPKINQFVKNELPSLLRFDILENWATNALAKRYDVIFNNLKSTNLGKIATDLEIQQLAKELSDQMTRSVGRKLGANGQQYLEFMEKLKAAKATKPYNVLNTVSKVDDLLVGLTEAQKAFEASNIFANNTKAQAEALRDFEQAIPELTAAKQALLESQTADEIVKSTENLENVINKNKYLFQFIEERKFLPSNFASTIKGAFGRQTGIAAAATGTVEQALYDSQKAKNAVQMAAKLGENPTAGRKAAVESLNVLKTAVMKIPALRGLATALEFVGKNMPIIDMLLSSADYVQFIYEMQTGKVKLNDPEHPEYIPLFVFSSFKMLLSISMVVAPPLIPILLPFDVAVSAAQIAGPGLAEQLGGVYEGVGWGGQEKINEMNRISEQAVGTPPSNPDAKIVYDWIIQNGFKKSITEIVLKNPNGNWNTFSDKWVQDAIKTFFDKAPDNIVDAAHTKILGGLDVIGSSWLKNPNDTRNQELKQSLLGLAINIVKAARQEAKQASMTPNQQQTQEYYNQQRPVKSNKVYNNRRCTTCPSI